MKKRFEIFREHLASLADERLEASSAKLPATEPVAWRDDPDPFGMDWKWAEPDSNASGDATQMSAPAPKEAIAESRRRTFARKWLVPIMAMAACVLVTFLVARQWPKEPEVQFASLTRRDQATRGAREIVAEVKNAGNERVFLTVVGLVPNQQFLPIHYRQENQYLEVPPLGSITVTNLPPEFEKAQTLVYILTRFPAPDPVRHSYPEKPAADRPEQFADQLRKNLLTLNIASDIRVLDVRDKK